MNANEEVKLSKFLSYVLRHQPDSIGIELDEHGWVPVQHLIDAARQKGHLFTYEDVTYVVAHNSKQRFAFSDDGLRIRANQGTPWISNWGTCRNSPRRCCTTAQPCGIWNRYCSRGC